MYIFKNPKGVFCNLLLLCELGFSLEVHLLLWQTLVVFTLNMNTYKIIYSMLYLTKFFSFLSVWSGKIGLLLLACRISFLEAPFWDSSSFSVAACWQGAPSLCSQEGCFDQERWTATEKGSLRRTILFQFHHTLNVLNIITLPTL